MWSFKEGYGGIMMVPSLSSNGLNNKDPINLSRLAT